MKLTVKKPDILDVLSKVQGLAGRRTNLAITTNVLIRAEGSEIILTATDLETGFEGAYPAQVAREGAVAINAKKLFEIIREFPTDEISLNEIENQWIEIGNGNVEYHIMGMNPEEFPASPKVEEVAFIDVDSTALGRMIDQTVIVAGGGDDRRAHITGVLMEMLSDASGPIFRMVSTDGSRLTTVNHELPQGFVVPEGPGVIVPKKGLSEVGRFLENTGSVGIGFKSNNFIVKKANETIIVRLLEGEFPQYSDIIKKSENSVPVVLEKGLFLKTLRRMSILSSDNYKGVIFKFEPGLLEVRANNPELGESKENLPVEYNGETMEIAFNPRYFMETLTVVEGEKIRLNLVDADKPCLIEGENSQTFLCIIMPMRI
jgi:DNA polymerase-3 subunit beta